MANRVVFVVEIDVVDDNRDAVTQAAAYGKHSTMGSRDCIIIVCRLPHSMTRPALCVIDSFSLGRESRSRNVKVQLGVTTVEVMQQCDDLERPYSHHDGALAQKSGFLPIDPDPGKDHLHRSYSFFHRSG
jgi:hypothetical protein